MSLEVVDHGPGIPATNLERVLDRFYRAGNTTGQASGPGLAIAAKVAAKHQVSFSISNRADGQGLMVSVRGLRRATAEHTVSAKRDASIAGWNMHYSTYLMHLGKPNLSLASVSP